MMIVVAIAIPSRGSAPKSVLRRLPHALMLDAPYTQYTMTKMTAQTTCRTELEDLKRLVRYCGIVMESSASIE